LEGSSPRILEKCNGEIVKIGVVGSRGYWGPNIVRVLRELNQEVVECDLKLGNNYTAFSDIDACCIVTPPDTHFEIAKYFTEQEIPVFVEKPLSDSLLHSAYFEFAKVPVMVGHTYLFSPAIRKIKDYLDELGDICYIDCQWRNLGLFQKYNVVWDLAPHPLSIIFYLVKSKLKNIFSHNYSHISDIEDTSTIILEFEDLQALLHLSWLDPQKVRQITIVGTKKMLVYDGTSALEPIRIFDKKIEIPDDHSDFGTFNMSYKYGDTLIPKIEPKEPLKEELKYFIECVEENKQPKINNIEDGMKVVGVIEQCQSAKK